MGPRTKFLGMVVLSLGLSCISVAAHADTTYAITTTTIYRGTVSGTLTGTDTTLSSFDVTAVFGPNSLVYDSTDSNTSGTFTDNDLQDVNGTEILLFDLSNGSGFDFLLPVYGDFTSGLTYAGNQADFQGGQPVGKLVTAAAVDPQGSVFTSDDVSLAPVSAVPEPSSIALLGTGLIGCVNTLRKRLRRR